MPIPDDERRRLARMIDHTLLKPDATPDQIERLCAEAREYGFAAVCVNPVYVRLCATELAGTDVAVCTVVGFPLGANTTHIKVAEALRAIEDGAREVDMVMQIGLLKAGDSDAVRRDIEEVARAVHDRGAILKVIIETALLTDDEKVTASKIIRDAGADFVKTSTGFGPGGAKVEDVALIRRTVGPKMGVKAAGGIRTYEDALAMIEAGATRIGASAGVKIVTGA